jgi:hypothetical protein
MKLEEHCFDGHTLLLKCGVLGEAAQRSRRQPRSRDANQPRRQPRRVPFQKVRVFGVGCTPRLGGLPLFTTLVNLHNECHWYLHTKEVNYCPLSNTLEHLNLSDATSLLDYRLSH